MRFISKIILILWAIAGGQFVACSNAGPEMPAPDNGAPAIVWTPAAPVKDAEVIFSLENDSDNVRSVLWIFGDGATAASAAGETVAHTYRAAGTYTVKAAVTLVQGPMTELSATVTVADTQIAIVVSNDHPARMEQVAFALTRIPGVSGIVWDFGDGSATQRVTDPAAQLEHRYEADGEYTASADISFDDGTTQTRTLVLTVEGRSLSYSCLNFDSGKMWIMAHRGNFNNGYDLAPNSMAAFRKCVELGCVDFIETDVQITKDGQVICLHDNYLSRFTDYSSYAGDKGYVSSFTREELRKYRLKTTDGKVTDEQIPTLEEVLLEFRGKVWFNIDKCGSNDVDIAKVYEVVKRCGCLDRVQFYVSTNSDKAAWLARQEQPGIIAPHANNVSVLNTMAAFAPVYMIQTSTGYVNSAWISSVNAKGLSVSNLLDAEGAAFHNGNTATMDGFVAAGLRMIQCDYPALMDEYLSGKGKR
ncbi:glycerophosphodiester phosphodiesterase family protein [uncultured Alistipes sp.]|uniref:glycerophosphodiester phosphodiesterase family protein n=1 Tax=uncultured Alistipes sp. TaxID=538949 RepID=UPI00272977E6|nr:glycerophosphodiester phosphodiesterase family protein [uncultured Alistipes sp.]